MSPQAPAPSRPFDDFRLCTSISPRFDVVRRAGGPQSLESRSRSISSICSCICFIIFFCIFAAFSICFSARSIALFGRLARGDGEAGERERSRQHGAGH